MPAFKSGVAVNTIERCGLEIKYLRVSAGPQRGKYVHTLVAEAMLGRELEPDEEVDHDDGDTFNNRWTNLKVRKSWEHAKVTRQRATEKRRRRVASVDCSDVPF